MDTNTPARLPVRILEGQVASSRATRAMEAYVRELDEMLEDGFDPALTEVTADEEVTPPRGDFLLITALTDDAVIACGAVRLIDPDTAELRRMWVEPSRRGQGFGRRLLRTLENRARALGARRAAMSLNEEMVAGLQLARVHGYVPVERFRADTTATVFVAKDL
ncbi:Acetyltransferase (GNAT) family protein [Raineyella antarctica]|uniref:Acetyltransferase (GNAT) family protein n=1 Tax=Raineyella antarctica TaxID=1577474 RepID=A0A1G6HBT0_9ACTN|nr:GNAT family N-acetyltransferase [Raineyella antarctica]SDB91395.1 Acetyltransferase (GNAT) family protein [Raineyella antarctica]